MGNLGGLNQVKEVLKLLIQHHLSKPQMYDNPVERSRGNCRFEVSRWIPFLFILLSLWNFDAFAEVKIGHFFPNHELLLGQSLVWTVRLEHPLEESYQLKVSPCPGADIRVENRAIEYLYDGKVRITYSLRVTPLSLEIPDVPSLVIYDEKGQSKAWNGGPIRVASISGNSMEIQQPATLLQPPPQKSITLWPLFLVPVLLFALIWIGLRRRWEKLPRQLFAKDLRRALSEVQKNRLPVQTWRLLRSHWIWNSSVESFTSAQLREAAGKDERLSTISQTLSNLESWKYGEASDSWDRTALEHSIQLAMEILNERRLASFPLPFRRNK